MKKAISTIAAGVILSLLAVGLLLWKRSGETPSAPVAQWLPSGTILLLELPDWRRTQTRWQQTALHQLIGEPEVAAFLERPRSRIPRGKLWGDPLEHLRLADPHQAFFAVARITDNMPHAVGGFHFRGTRRDEMESLIAKARTQAQTASPTGKSDLIQYRAFEIETFSDKGVTVTGAFANDWYFFGNDVELLKSTLDRFATLKTPGSLLDEPAYAKSMVHLPSNPDFRFYAAAAGLVERLLTLSSAAGRSLDPGQTAELKKVQAVAGSTRLEDQRMRDTLFVLKPGDLRQPVLTRQTLGLTSRDTIAYYASIPSIPDRLPLPYGPANAASGAGAPPTSLLGGFQGMLTALGEQGVRMEDFKAAFGPEFAAILNWPAPSPNSLDESSPPAIELAAQVRDAAVACKFTEALCASWKREQTNGLVFWKWPSGDGGNAPVLGLTDRFLLAGLSAETLKTPAAKLKSTGATLEKSPAFTSALGTVTQPGHTLLYVDAKPLFERVYEWLRPMAMVWANFVPHAGDYVQMAKLPSTEAVSRHLHPMVLAASQNDDGTLIESSGTVTFFQAAAALAGFTGAAAVPVIEGKVTVPGLDALIDTYLLGVGPKREQPGSQPAATKAPAGSQPSPHP